MALCASFEFRVLPTASAMAWSSINVREEYITAFDGLARSTLQRILEIVQMRKMCTAEFGVMSIPAFARHWEQHFKKSSSQLSEEVKEKYIEKALRLYDNVLCNPLVMQGLTRMEEEWGKNSPMMTMAAVDALCKKTKEPRTAAWVCFGMLDSVQCGFATLPDFKGASLTGARGHLDLLTAKHGILQHLLHHWCPKKNFKPSDIETLKAVCESHETWRGKCGGGPGTHRPDLSWQGLLGAHVQKTITFISGTVFGSAMDDRIRSSLKISTAPAEIVTHEPFCNMLSQIIPEQPAAVVPAAEAAANAGKNPASATTTVTLDSLALPADVRVTKEEDLSRWLEEAKVQVDRFIKLIDCPDNSKALGDLLKATAVGAFRVDDENPRKQRIAMLVDSKTGGEASCQAHLRKPNFQEERIKKIVRGFLASRGCEDPDDTTLFLMMDGFRNLETQMWNCCVRPDGNRWSERWADRDRQHFVVEYEEQAMVKRKLRQRGILQLAEGLHVFSAKGVDITPRAHLRYKNSTSSQVIGPVIAPDWSCVWRESKVVKDRIYGASGRILAGGRLPVDDVPRPSFEDACDPVSWHAMPVSFIEEIVHKFELRVLCDATCTSDEAALACLRMGISYVGLCWSEEHARLLQSRLVSQLWKEWTNA
ncbi:unnamed protein product, partial [Symbiodinium sp. CCMP2456]